MLRYTPVPALKAQMAPPPVYAALLKERSTSTLSVPLNVNGVVNVNVYQPVVVIWATVAW